MQNRIIYLICGLPCSGKDWYVVNKLHGHEAEIVSFDKVRINLYQKDHDTTQMDSIERYNKAWAWCNENKIDLMGRLIEDIKIAFALGLQPFICNTMLTRKSRSAMMNSLKNKIKDVEFRCVFLLVNSEVAKERNLTRTSHRLSPEVMDRFLNGPQELPTLTEGFELVNIVHSDRVW